MADAGPVVRVAVTPTFDDYARLCNALSRQQGVIRIRLVLGAVLLLVAVWAVYRGSQAGQDAGPYWTLLCLTLAGQWFVFVKQSEYDRRRIKAGWDGSEAVRERRAYEFSDDGICHAGETSSGRTSWSLIKRAEVIAGFLVLTNVHEAVYYLPESALSDGQRADLDELLRAHVPGFAGLPARR